MHNAVFFYWGSAEPKASKGSTKLS